MKPRVIPILFSLVLTACQTDVVPADVEEGAAGDEVAVEVLPTPFTAEEIQAACMPGTQVVFRIEAQGHPPFRQYMRFSAGDDESATVETWTETLEGAPLGPRQTQTSAWSELRDHALLPLGSTRERATHEGVMGPYDGWRYVQPIDDERGTGQRELWFADRLPGPPLLVIETIGGETVSRVEMIARAMP